MRLSNSSSLAPRSVLWSEIFPALALTELQTKCARGCKAPTLFAAKATGNQSEGPIDTRPEASDCPVDPSNIHEQIKQIELIPLTALILFTNMLVLAFIVGNKKFHNPTYIFIASLGIADLFVGFVSIVTISTKASERNQDLCLTRIGVTIAAVMASVWSLVCVAVDRYIAVTRALVYKLVVTKRRTAYGIFTSWTLTCLFGFAPLLGWRDDFYGNYCSFMYVLTTPYIITLFFFSAFIPISIMLVIYTKLFRSARFHIKRIQALEVLQAGDRNNSGIFGISTRTLRSIKTFAAVLGCVIVTWSPLIITTIFQIFSGNKTCYLKDIIGSHLLVIGFSNSFLNPLIYALGTKDFRSKIRDIFRGRCYGVTGSQVYPRDQ